MFKKHGRRSSAASIKVTTAARTKTSSATAAANSMREAPHLATRYDAGTGQGTIMRIPKGKTLEHPILDGSTEGRSAQLHTVNPFRGRRDPALGEWNYTRDHAHEHDLMYEPERRRLREAIAAAHARDLEPRHWYKYDPFREERNRLKMGGAGPV